MGWTNMSPVYCKWKEMISKTLCKFGILKFNCDIMSIYKFSGLTRNAWTKTYIYIGYYIYFMILWL